MEKSPPVILTACTNRKRFTPEAELRAAALPRGSLSTVASCWLTRLRRASTTVRADQLYVGRSFIEAQTAAKGSNLYVVSAGLGVIPAHAPIPAYSLTVAPGSADDVLSVVNEAASAADWWRAGPAKSPSHVTFDDIRLRLEGRLILAALPSAYLKMIADDLERLVGLAGDCLRLFCGAPPVDLPARLSATVMPYDARFDGPDSPLLGTQSDFAQRAMRHFTQNVLPYHGPDVTAEAHSAAVKRILTGFRPRAIIDRDKATDDEIVALVIQNWSAAEGRAGRMLRLLRDVSGVACEQRRFVRLFQVAAEHRHTRAPA